MKSINKPLQISFLKPTLLALLILAFSCSPETELEADIANAEKSKTDNTETGDAQSEDAINDVNYDVDNFITGAALHGANGIDVGPDGNLYIASVNGQEIIVMNKHTGEIINRFGPERGVLGPDDLVFGPDGTLYWTDILTGYVGRMTADGQILGYQFVAPGVNPITFSPEGRLFVALDFLGDGFYELDPELLEPPIPIIVASEANPFPLGFFNAFDFCDESHLYGPLFAAGLVIKVDVNSECVLPSSDPFGDGIAEVVAGGFVNPASAKFGPDGYLYVLDQTGEVFKVNISNGEKTLFATCEPGLDNMVFDEDGTLYMTNNDQGWVAEVSSSGQFHFISPGGMIAPEGLAVLPGSDGDDALFVADLFRLREFNGSSGEEENFYRGALVPEGEESLILPMNLAADGNKLIISSWFSGGVQVWDPETNHVTESFAFPAPIDAVRVNGNIVVSDAALGGVVAASDNSLIVPLNVASGLVTDGTTLWAADWATGEILQVDFNTEPPTVSIVAAGLANPEGLALDLEGRLLVVETGASRLSRLDLATGEVAILAEGLELSGPGLGSPPTWGFDGVAVGTSGAIYVSGWGAPNVIYKISQSE